MLKKSIAGLSKCGKVLYCDHTYGQRHEWKGLRDSRTLSATAFCKVVSNLELEEKPTPYPILQPSRHGRKCLISREWWKNEHAKGETLGESIGLPPPPFRNENQRSKNQYWPPEAPKLSTRQKGATPNSWSQLTTKKAAGLTSYLWRYSAWSMKRPD